MRLRKRRELGAAFDLFLPLLLVLMSHARESGLLDGATAATGTMRSEAVVGLPFPFGRHVRGRIGGRLEFCAG
jgi:hypothetical protein